MSRIVRRPDDNIYLAKLASEFGQDYNLAYMSAVNRSIDNYKDLYEYYVFARDIILETTNVVSSYSTADLAIVLDKPQSTITYWLIALYGDNAYRHTGNVDNAVTRLKQIKEFVRSNGKVGIVDYDYDNTFRERLRREFLYTYKSMDLRKQKEGVISYEEVYFITSSGKHYIDSARMLFKTTTNKRMAEVLGVSPIRISNWKRTVLDKKAYTRKSTVDNTIRLIKDVGAYLDITGKKHI